MSRSSSVILIIALVLAAQATGCGKEPVGPVNHDPVMTSLTVFPTDIGVSDSAVVTCIATDSDGDTLVYDWSTDLRLRIRGVPPDFPIKNNTFNNEETFYPNFQPVTVDSAYVVCLARDRRGGAAIKAVTIMLHP